jgi:23S rRNA pseudouridine1911/1915/1917 synthase
VPPSPIAPAPSRGIDVPRESAGERLDRFLARSLPCTPERARWLVKEGRVRIRGKACSSLRRLSGGERVEVDVPAPRQVARALAEPDLSVLHDRAGALVVDKPPGLAVEPAGPSSPSAVGAASRIGRFDVDGRAGPGLPHRLDRDTSGCLLLARTDAALEALRRAFLEGRVEKVYLAIVAGEPPDQGALDTPYGRRKDDPRRFTTRIPSPRRARLSFRVERRLAGAALLRVRLETGRTHQIRVQLAEAGWPVLGDATYGVASPALGRQALHAWTLAFPAPGTGHVVEVEAPVPADLQGALAALSVPAAGGPAVKARREP